MLRRLRVLGLPSLIVAALWLAGWSGSQGSDHPVTRVEPEVLRRAIEHSARCAAEEQVARSLHEQDLVSRLEAPPS